MSQNVTKHEDCLLLLFILEGVHGKKGISIDSIDSQEKLSMWSDSRCRDRMEAFERNVEKISLDKWLCLLEIVMPCNLKTF